MQKFKKIYLIIFSLFSIFLFKGVVEAATTYKMYEDSNGVRWQYAYIEDSDRVEISFFDNRNSRENVTLPSLSNLRSNDSTIPASATKLVVVNYANHSLGTPATQTKNITTINLSNATVINGVAPMINEEVVTTITFSSAVGTSIGTEAFMGYKLTINNLDKVVSIGDRAFKNAELTYKNINLSNLTTIGDAAFQGTNIEKVTIINTERIEYNAFRDCLELVSVKLGDNVKDIGDAAFQNAQKLTTINYNNVTKVGNYAFADCTSYNVDISNTKLTDIGDAAYSNTTGFTKSITIPDGVTFLGWRVFYRSGITGVDLNNVEYMNSSKQREYSDLPANDKNSFVHQTGQGETFAECPNLSKIDFGKVWYIPYAAFFGNKSLKEVNFSDSVLMVHDLAFTNCNIEKLNLNKVQRIETASFADNNLTEIYLPKSINYLKGIGAFASNPINKMTIAYDTMSSNLSNIVTDLFPGYSYIKYGENYQLDGSSSGFCKKNDSYCKKGVYNSLKEVVFEAAYGKDEEPVIDSVFGSTHMKYSEYIKKLTDRQSYLDYILEYPSSKDDKYKGDVLANPDQYKNIIKPYYFTSAKAIENITIGEGYEFIGQGAFWFGDGNFDFYNNSGNKDKEVYNELYNIKKVSLPESLKAIGRFAFLNSIWYEAEINLPEGLEYIGDEAFFWCMGFTNDLDLPNLRYLGVNAFAMTGIGNIYLHDKLEYIGLHAFFTAPYAIGSPNNIDPRNFRTKEIVFDVDLYGIETIGKSTNSTTNCVQHFSHINNQTPWYYHYKEGQELPEYDLIKFTDKVVTEPCGGFSLEQDYLPSYGVNNPSSAFFFGIRAKKIDLGETGWKNVGYGMFNSVKAEEIILPKNLERIEATAFQGARVKKEIEIPDTVKFIGTSAFDNKISAVWSNDKIWEIVGEDQELYNLKIKNIPKSLEHIGDNAFYGALFPNGIVIPAGVTSIGGSAFAFDKDYGYGNENKHGKAEISSVTIECNLPASITMIHFNNNNNSKSPYGTLADIFYRNKIKKMTFGENVTELPGNDTEKIVDRSEFYGLDVEEVEFKNLKELPDKAFIDDTNLKKVTFNNGLEKIGDFAFYNTSLEEVNLPDNNGTIEVGYSAFRKTNLESIGDDNSSLNVLDNKIVTTGPYAFADNNNLRTVIVPDGFNDNVVEEYTFKNCNNLNKVDVYRDIKTINSEAFNGDYNFKKLFLWGDTKIEQNNVDEISGSGKIKVINTSAYYANMVEAKKEDSSIVIPGFTIKSPRGDIVLNKQQIDDGYTYEYDGTGKITFEHPSEVIVNLVKTSDGYIANIEDVKETKDYGDFTIPAATDLYSYSTYDVKKWEADNSDTRRSEELGTDAKFYDLDEVLYLTSNHPKVKLTDDKKDFDKSKLIVYALRRDGIIMESDKWGEYTKDFARTSQDINFEKYDSNTLEDTKMVYDTPYPAEEADVSTENFKSMRYEIVDAKGILPKKEIELYYTNSMIETTVDTTIEIETVIDKITDIVDTGSGRVISTIIFLILSFLGLRFILLKRKKKLIKI